MCITPTLIIRTYVHFIRRNKHSTQKTSFFAPPPSEPGRAQDPKKGPERVGLGCFFTPFWSKKPFVQKSLVLPCRSPKRVPKNVFLSFSLQFYSYFFFNYKPAARSSKTCFGTPFFNFCRRKQVLRSQNKLSFLQPVYSVCRSQTKKNESNWILLLGIYSEFRLFIFAGVLQCFFDARKNTIKKQTKHIQVPLKTLNLDLFGRFWDSCVPFAGLLQCFFFQLTFFQLVYSVFRFQKRLLRKK